MSRQPLDRLAAQREAAVILMVGGTGDLGARIVSRLVVTGVPVRCLARSGSNTASLSARGVEIVTGDLTDPHSLRRACTNAEVVVASATAIGRRLAGHKRPTIREADEAGMMSLIESAEAAGVRRFVYVSYAGVDASLGTPLERAKVAVERRLAASPMRRVVLRPDAFQEIHLGPLGRFNVATGEVAVFGKGDTKRRWVATEDVAALAAAVVSEPDPPALIEFGGPEALSRNEAVAIAERACGRSFKVRRVPLLVARVGMRLAHRRNDALASVLGTGVLQDLAPGDWDDAPLRDRGIAPRPASDWILQQSSAAL